MRFLPSLLLLLTLYRRLTNIKTSASAHPTTRKNVLVRLVDAERVAEELKDAWTKLQVEYLHLIVSRSVLPYSLAYSLVYADHDWTQHRAEDR
jgi:hypothetical protein